MSFKRGDLSLRKNAVRASRLPPISNGSMTERVNTFDGHDEEEEHRKRYWKAVKSYYFNIPGNCETRTDQTIDSVTGLHPKRPRRQPMTERNNVLQGVDEPSMGLESLIEDSSNRTSFVKHWDGHHGDKHPGILTGKKYTGYDIFNSDQFDPYEKSRELLEKCKYFPMKKLRKDHTSILRRIGHNHTASMPSMIIKPPPPNF